MRKIKSKKNKKNKKGGGYALEGSSLYLSKINPKYTGISPTTYVSLKYYEFVAFSLATVTGGQQLFNLNSLFDPNRTGSGHQPYYFDGLALMYNRYRVVKAKWRITLSAAQGVLVCVVPMNGTQTAVTNQTTFEAIAEMPYAKNSIIPATGGPVTILKGAIDLNLLNGALRQEFLDDDRFEAQVAASPAEVITLLIALYNPSGSTSAVNVGCEIIYEANLHDQLPVSQSMTMLRGEANRVAFKTFQEKKIRGEAYPEQPNYKGSPSPEKKEDGGMPKILDIPKSVFKFDTTGQNPVQRVPNTVQVSVESFAELVAQAKRNKRSSGTLQSADGTDLS